MWFAQATAYLTAGSSAVSRISPSSVLVCLLLLLRSASWAHDVITTKLTYTRDISRILEQRCLVCHGEGSSIPLTTYEQVRPWAVSIKEQVLSRSMPPWGAVKGFGDLDPDAGLSEEDMLVVAGWVVGGAPRGDLKLLRPAPVQSLGKAQSPAHDVLRVDTSRRLAAPLRISSIRPIVNQTIGNIRITAQFPDGRTVPLVWLYRYEPKWAHDFAFRHPLLLPAGTMVEASSPLVFVLKK